MAFLNEGTFTMKNWLRNPWILALVALVTTTYFTWSYGYPFEGLIPSLACGIFTGWLVFSDAKKYLTPPAQKKPLKSREHSQEP